MSKRPILYYSLPPIYFRDGDARYDFLSMNYQSKFTEDKITYETCANYVLAYFVVIARRKEKKIKWKRPFC